ncbi:Integrase family protein OS=Tsukamurella paurometabola (strain ATCC 8368 / DSM / CCUG 35730/ CIP 100753 / JCM 10117 / KCTC 9821 / NBRC 16120 / NCIMB 702349/ NCTC 13040) OX=521096 GN=Tpau_1423 PE=4 SV=1 [Tsukamurella paurometabola]|uniref:Integrase family protein n=1 Tax=Tsukamurella paurometabola (strain ATCC 8368 / DSM 20162 / CCUG 35730 / CIP 100753 / JCM 10117 / KCTC 9821 / NBRC 16120 / NCIMB 702349 / NCTC 13040) TaxID=521096 RepID=D5UXF9_TSUPD|nr:tyrosine-type recombinase/integrase [Tsukamurella paurometabola]ADG78051.1 integrase family protein [Tsukamurella paurometabola DSM 20162]SUP29953.1 Integrase [Tsukamurella paurometabola]
MASVHKFTSRVDGKPYYKVKWRTPDGKHRTRGGFARRRDAEAYAETVEFSARRGLTFDPRSGDMLFRAAGQAWLQSRTDLKIATRTNYTGQLRADGEIDRRFGGYPLNKITREDLQAWVNEQVAGGSSSSSVRNKFFIVRMILSQAVVDRRLEFSPADHVKLPAPRRKGKQASTASGQAASMVGSAPSVHGSTEDAAFLTAEQVEYLTAATPWPYNILVHMAAWTGLRSGELTGLQIGDIDLGRNSTVSVQRTALVVPGTPADGDSPATAPRAVYDTPKTRRSRRRVPLTAATVAVLRDYLAPAPRLDGGDRRFNAAATPLAPRIDAPSSATGAPTYVHPRAGDPTAPLFPKMRLVAGRPTGKRAPRHETGPRAGQPMTPEEQAARRTVAEAQARLELDWNAVLLHKTYYKAVFQPALLRASLALVADGLRPIPEHATAHSLRHTYASFCVSAGLHPKQISSYCGHASVNTTMGIYAHLFEDDHTEAMAALGSVGATRRDNVTPLRGWG